MTPKGKPEEIAQALIDSWGEDAFPEEPVKDIAKALTDYGAEREKIGWEKAKAEICLYLDHSLEIDLAQSDQAIEDIRALEFRTEGEN
jgi:hypothetical protein